jgi:hypothetical protein
MYLSKYGVARHFYIPMVKRGVVDFAVSADWTPAAGDVKISKDGGAAANVTNLPTAITMGNGAIWDFSITATEMQAAQIMITVADSATKAVEDTMLICETYGNASAQHPVDLADSVRAGLTALPNATAGATNGLPLSVDSSGRVDVLKVNGTSQTARDLGASVLLSSGTGAGQVSLSSGTVTVGTNNDKTGYSLTQSFPSNFSSLAIDSSGRVNAFLIGILTSVFTEGATGRIAAAFKQFFNIATPAATMDHGILVDTASTVTNPVTAGTVSDKTGYALTSAYDAAKTASQAGDAMALTSGERTTLAGVIWNALTSGLTMVGSIGKRLVDNLTGDIYARIGAPAGASVSADIAAVKTDTAAVKVQTDKLTFTVSNQVDSNVLDWKSSTAPAMTGDAYARLGAPAGASVSADIAAVKTVDDAVKAKTDNLPASPAAVGDVPTANQNADAYLDRADAIETGLTPRGAMRLNTAALAGKLSGAAGTTVTIRNVGDSKDRITATVDSNGNRTAVTTDAT